jgi:competence protein ComEA
VLSRHRSGTPAPDAEARVGRLLGQPVPTGGWVPPESDDGPWTVEQADLPTAGPERSWTPRGSDPDDVGRAPAAADEAPAPARARLLPATLAGGRLDPGHRGAVALLLVCLLAAVVAAGAVLHGRPQQVEVPALEQAGTALPGVPEPVPVPEPEPTELVVAVAGEVVSPGLVRLPPGSRVDDALRAAGGLSPGGSSGLLNLARPLADGEQVVVGPDAPPDATPAAAGAGAATSGVGSQVRLNSASAAELESLPGIGPVLAERIVEWRLERGPFASVDQLREVPGIGEAKYAAVKAKVAL